MLTATRGISIVMTMSVSQPIRDGAWLARVMLERLPRR
jgi:hypothetical protein